MENAQLLKYLKEGIDHLLECGGFDNGLSFKPTQNEALEAYRRYLNADKISEREKLKGFFSIPTGVGKTAIFIGIITAAHEAAAKEGQVLKTAIVVPTTQLLKQTLEAMQGNQFPDNHPDYFQGFAPQTKGKIGLFGDGKRNLKQPFTIMTYDAWFDLSHKGVIGSHNIDILISDEAHRGTSERRVEKIADAFDDRTCQLAFTATAHFDKEKSVKNSHGNEIYDKPMRDAVADGELAAYIQSQPTTIRVEPTKFMLSEEFRNAAEGRQIKYRRRLKQRAWNDFALKVFREGRDERTGDLLTDNDAGFFVDSTDQADELEEMLNNDPVLQERAKARGKKGVAIAIHTNGMSKNEQQRRFDEYLRGKYLAVIGDEKFKEGFDYAPMKTLFDYHRKSVVDKVQIIGRGARKWWNSQKGRWEGLTVVEAAIYIGNEDPDLDDVFKKFALKNNQRVRDVLESSIVLGPDKDLPAYSKRRSGAYGGTKEDLFDANPNIEYLIDPEDVYELDSNISKLRKEHFIVVDDEIRLEILEKLTAAQLTPHSFVGGLNDAPAFLQRGTQLMRILDGSRSAIDPELLKYIHQKLDYVLEGRLVIKLDLRRSEARKARDAEGRVPLTADMITKIRDLRDKTGMSGSELLKHAKKENVPKGFNGHTISKWLANNHPKTVFRETYDFAVRLYEHVFETFESQGYDLRKIPLDRETLSEMTSLSEKTGIKAEALLNRSSKVPPMMTRGMLQVWFRGEAETARKFHIDWALSEWRKHEKAMKP